MKLRVKNFSTFALIVAASSAVVLTSVVAFSDEILKALPGTSRPAPEELPKPASLPSVLVDLPSTRYAAAYKISMGDVVVGTAAFGQDELSSIGPTHLDLRMLSRIGASPLLAEYSQRLSQSEQGLQINMDVSVTGRSLEIARGRAVWLGKNGALKYQANLEDVDGTPLQQGLTDVERQWTEDTALIFFKPKGTSPSRFFNPISGKFVSSKDFTSKFDDDGFLSAGKVAWENKIVLEFTRLTFSELPQLAEKTRRGLVDLAWFSDNPNGNDELYQLRTTADACAAFAKSAEQDVTRRTPEVPYLLHRKIFNLQRMCTRISQAANQIGSRSKSEVLDKIIVGVREIFLEDKRELPESLVSAPEWDSLRDINRKGQWARSVNYLIQQAQNELAHTISIEQKQKTRLELRVNIEKLGSRSVVKGMLRPRSLAIQTTVDIAQNDNMLASSWKTVPAFTEDTVAQITKPGAVTFNANTLPFELINGQAFAREDVKDLGEVCSRFAGRIGLDLGDAPQEIFRTNIARGTWDRSTRLQIVPEFARRAAASPDCRFLVFRVPANMAQQTEEALITFKREILQTETAFQFSNGGSRKMRLVPGTYDFIASSLVNGNILGKQEIVVSAAKSSTHANVRIK